MLITDLQDFAKFISFYSPIPVILLGTWTLVKRHLANHYKAALYYTLAGFIIDQLAKYAAMECGNSMPFIHLFGLIEVVILGYFFSLIMPTIRRALLWVVAGMSLLYIINSLVFEPLLTFNFKALFASTIALLFICLYYFYYLYRYEPYEYPHKSGVFWIVVALLVYFSGTFFSFLLATKTVTVPWVFHNLLNASKNLLIFTGLWLGVKNYGR